MKKGRIEELRARVKAKEPTDAETLANQRVKERAKAHKREQKKIVTALEKELADYADRQAFLDALSKAPDPKPFKIRKLKGQGKRLPAATYFPLASDWHMGERVDLDHTGGRNEYNPEIAQERARKFWKSNLIMLNAARSAWDIRQGVLWLGGDLMTGYLREENEEANFLSPTKESLLVFKTIVSGLHTFLDQSDLDRLLIVTSNGNHGRTGKKIRIQTYSENSYEWLLYQHLKFYFEKLEEFGKVDKGRITWQIANGYNNVVDTYGFRTNFHHGDAVGYAGGVGGVSMPMNRRIGRQATSLPLRWEGTELGVPHMYVNGHFHYLCYPGLFMQNGSLIGWNDFAEWIGCPYSDPMQGSFVIDERHKIVSNFNPIIVT